jgi:flagellar hook assembly protein FlgD/outer membrane protein OmpA-like peptidoglycan-associated protein
VNVPIAVVDWKIAIASRSDSTRVIRTYSGKGNPPATVNFDGKDDNGIALPDGAYIALLSGTFENGDRAQAEPLDLTIDTKAPEATITATPRVFGGSRGPTTSINLKADWSANWTGVLEYAGGKIEVPAAQYGIGAKDFPFVWNGTDLNGKPVPDGAYTIYVYGTDAAGNRGESNHVVIGKITGPTPINLSLPEKAFSPNGDGIKDTISIMTDAKLKVLIDKFIVVIKDSSGQIVRSSETRKAADTFVWDGRTNAGTLVPDGQYTVDFEVLYQNGNDEKATAGPIIVDTQAPKIDISADNTTFSPNGDGIRDTVTITQHSGTADHWTGQFLNSQGKVVREYSWPNQAQTFVWDGTDQQGNKVPDGPYTYVVQAQDAAGNIGRAELKLNVNPLSGLVNIEPQSAGFSPNGDGVMDTMNFDVSVAKKEGMKSWSASFVNDQKGVVRTVTGGSSLPATITWDGKTDLGFVLDGTYHARLTVTYDNGSSEQMESTKSFVVDTVAPKTSVTVSPVPFSPDGDGINETVTISMAATDSLAGIKDWTLDILDPMGHSFMKYSGTGAPPPSVVWDGHARSGELVQSGMDYSAVLTVTNEYGVTGTGGGVISVDILVIKEGDHYRIRVPSIYFGPNTSDLFLVDDTLLTKNLETLRRLAKILNRYEHYNILIQGNAVSVLWYNSKLAAEEQKETLIPLSRARAREVMKALAILGVDRHRISIEGLGGSNPIVPFSDLQNRWKDRRVEFLLTTPPSGVKPAKQ